MARAAHMHAEALRRVLDPASWSTRASPGRRSVVRWDPVHVQADAGVCAKGGATSSSTQMMRRLQRLRDTGDGPGINRPRPRAPIPRRWTEMHGFAHWSNAPLLRPTNGEGLQRCPDTGTRSRSGFRGSHRGCRDRSGPDTEANDSNPSPEERALATVEEAQACVSVHTMGDERASAAPSLRAAP